MRKVAILLFMVVNLINCQVLPNQYSRKIKDRELSCYINLPKPLMKEIKLIGHGVEYQYWFSDSSVIYITNEFSISNLNYEKIYSIPDVYYERQFLKDTLVVSGLTTDGRYWSDRKLGIWSLGYSNVLKEEVTLFEESLSSFKISDFPSKY